MRGYPASFPFRHRSRPFYWLWLRPESFCLLRRQHLPAFFCIKSLLGVEHRVLICSRCGVYAGGIACDIRCESGSVADNGLDLIEKLIIGLSLASARLICAAVDDQVAIDLEQVTGGIASHLVAVWLDHIGIDIDLARAVAFSRVGGVNDRQGCTLFDIEHHCNDDVTVIKQGYSHFSSCFRAISKIKFPLYFAVFTTLQTIILK